MLWSPVVGIAVTVACALLAGVAAAAAPTTASPSWEARRSPIPHAVAAGVLLVAATLLTSLPGAAAWSGVAALVVAELCVFAAQGRRAAHGVTTVRLLTDAAGTALLWALPATALVMRHRACGPAPCGALEDWVACTSADGDGASSSSVYRAQAAVLACALLGAVAYSLHSLVSTLLLLHPPAAAAAAGPGGRSVWERCWRADWPSVVVSAAGLATVGHLRVGAHLHLAAALLLGLLVAGCTLVVVLAAWGKLHVLAPLCDHPATTHGLEDACTVWVHALQPALPPSSHSVAVALSREASSTENNSRRAVSL
jgi:hypothetical protein